MVDGPQLDTPREYLRHADEQWRDVAGRVLGPDAELIAVSRYFCDSRVYGADGRVAKIRLKPQIENAAYLPLAAEAEFLESMGRTATYGTHESWEYVIQESIEGTMFSAHLFKQQDTSYGFSERVRVLRRIIPELRAEHRRGISHGDLQPENVLITEDGVSLIDFDRALRQSPRLAAYRDWVGIGPRSFGSPFPFWKLAITVLAPRARSALIRIRRAVRSTEAKPIESADPALADLDYAWRTAERSKANSQGKGLAYYAFSFRGHHFPGERAWYTRWDAIRQNVEVEGKSVLELGCNMGLLSTFASLSGATSAHGVDYYADIIDAARRVARGLGADATFDQLDLMSPQPWEVDLGGRDIVTALSVVHWLPEKERVLKFLGTHQELIYEGHDTLDIESARLRALGFDRIDVILESERDRHVLHARKT